MALAALPPTPVWPLLAYFLAVLILTGGMIGTSYLLGQRRMGRTTGEPFECGVLPVGSARQRWDVRFYLIAMFFVIFDLESVFIFAWAVNVRALGWGGYAAILFFIAILLAALVYIWREGAFNWGIVRTRPSGNKS